MLRDIFFNYFPNILSYLYFKCGIRLVPVSQEEIDFGGVKRVCVLATSGIGNLVMLTPLLNSLRQAITDVSITLVVASEVAKKLLDGAPLADEIIVMNDKNKKKALKMVRNNWPDLTIAATHRGYMRAKTAFRTGARYKVGFRYDYMNCEDTDFFFTHPIPYEEDKHEVEQALALLEPLGLYGRRELCLYITPDEDEEVERILLDAGRQSSDLLIGCHISSNTKPKYLCWPKEHFAELCNHLTEEYAAKIIIVGGDAEVPVIEEMATLMHEKPIILAGKTTIRQTAAVIKRLKLFIANDGGPMHIAAAVKTPVIGIFGPTDPKIYAPYGEDCFVVKSSLPCIPCHKPHSERYGCETGECFTNISFEEVLKVARKVLGDEDKPRPD